MRRCRSWLTLLTILALTAGAAADKGTRPAKAVETFDAVWQTIKDTHYDPNINGIDWEGVKKELRPKAEQAATTAELRGVIRELLGRLKESHFALLEADVAETLSATGEGKSGDGKGGTTKADEAQAGDVGLDARFVEGKILVTAVEPGGPADQAGVKPGWEIRQVGTTPTADLIAKVPARFDARQAQVTLWSAVKHRLEGAPGTTVALTFADGQDREQPRELKRWRAPGEATKFGHLPTLTARLTAARKPLAEGRSAGVIRFNVWLMPIAREFEKAFLELRDADGLVIDLRGNPGGLAMLGVGVSRYLAAKEFSLGTMKLRGGTWEFKVEPRGVTSDGQPLPPYPGAVAVLTDAATVSTSEFFAAGLQAAGRVKVFGAPSLGAALPSVLKRLPNGDVLQHAIADYVLPDGRRVEGHGVTPDVAVPLTRQDLLAGRDAPLETALKWIADQPRAQAR
jgi:carboxyl-terminal processing protease